MKNKLINSENCRKSLFFSPFTFIYFPLLFLIIFIPIWFMFLFVCFLNSSMHCYCNTQFQFCEDYNFDTKTILLLSIMFYFLYNFDDKTSAFCLVFVAKDPNGKTILYETQSRLNLSKFEEKTKKLSESHILIHLDIRDWCNINMKQIWSELKS